LQGMPTPIPGRLEFENVDLGGINVAWRVDDHGNNASGKDYRPAQDLPNICCLNCLGVIDKYPDGGIYPSADQPHGYYIGWAHPNDWTKFTVNVAKAGIYKISSTFASQPNSIKFSLWFNDVNKTGIISLPGTNDYHIWRPFDIGTVELDAGTQVMKFQMEGQYHLQYDYLLFEFVGDADAGAPGNTDGGAPGDTAIAPGGSDAGAEDGSASATVAGSGAPSSGASSSPPGFEEPPDAGAMSTGPSASPSASAAAGSAINAARPSSSSNGCSVVPGSAGDGDAFPPGVLFLGALLIASCRSTGAGSARRRQPSAEA
ncbi:MAG TPA: carbohydrate-binding protein, partial [Polyangiaceae bacterium]|nr:carbohydrate-binding protein [Polyangiaceae bacterium]